MSSAVKEAFGGIGTFTIANANLARSLTAGWKSNAIDNTVNLYLDYLIHFRFAAVNTAPANGKVIIAYAFALDDPAGTNYTSTGDGTPDGTEGTLTYPDYTSLTLACPVLGWISYPIQNRAINAGPFSVARCFGGIIPPKFCIGMINDSGMTLSVTAIEYNGIYNNVG